MDDFKKLVDEVASYIFMQRGIVSPLHTEDELIDVVKQAVSELQKRQEAVGYIVPYEDLGVGYDRRGGNVFWTDKPNDGPLFRFPPSCEAKVKELENECDQLRSQVDILEEHVDDARSKQYECERENEQLSERLSECENNVEKLETYIRDIT